MVIKSLPDATSPSFLGFVPRLHDIGNLMSTPQQRPHCLDSFSSVWSRVHASTAAVAARRLGRAG